MRSILVPSLVVLTVVVAACGDYSNEDIVFLEAIPNASALSIKVAAGPSTALTADASLHTDTVVTAQGVNAALGVILGLLDLVRTLPPSHRTATSRTWGPFDDHSHPGFEIEVTLTRGASGPYDFAFAERKVLGGGAFTPVITGTFFTQSAHLGHGTLHFATSSQAQVGFDGGNPNLSTLDVVYANDQSPRRVTTTIAGTDEKDGRPVSTTYAFEEAPDTSGKLVFDLSTDFLGDGGKEDLHLVSVWRADGAGRSDGEISGDALNMLLGDGGSDRIAECWNANFAETYYDSERFTAPDGGSLGEGLDCVSGQTHPTCPDGEASACVVPAAWP